MVRLVTVEHLNQSEAARRLKVARQTVSRWMSEYGESGEAALAQAGRAGRKPLRSSKQRARIVELLQQGPQWLGYETPLWTCPRVGAFD